MDIFLYEKRILALDSMFHKVRRQLERLTKRAWHSRDSVDWKAAKYQLDMIKTLIRITKEEAAFFLRLGQLYDVMKFHNDLFGYLERRDPDLLHQILTDLNNQYQD